jgi:L-asparaginase
MGIRIFVTGGTFDKEYDEIRGRLYFRDSHLAEMLRMGRNRAEVEIRTLMMVDSLEMTDGDRETIVRNCQEVPERHIVITHGTDTMVDTARLLASEVPGKSIVLTGAMIPMAFGSSDGLFNLGGALTAVQCLPAGVWITMNGLVFPWDNVRKNRERGVFEPLDRERLLHVEAGGVAPD